MITRMTFLSFPPEKKEELKKIYQEETTPMVRKQKGNLDCMLLEPLNPADEYVSLTTWDSQEDADNYQSSGVYKQLVDRVRPFFTKEPVLKVYQSQHIMEHV